MIWVPNELTTYLPWAVARGIVIHESHQLKKQSAQRDRDMHTLTETEEFFTRFGKYRDTQHQ